MITFQWGKPNPPQTTPNRQSYGAVSPETARVIQALERGQRSRVQPMPPPATNKPRR